MRRYPKIHLLQWLTLFLGFIALNAAATTYYVDINSPTPTPPYTSWSTASTDIQSAVNQTTNGDLVLVNPGVYQSAGYTAPDGGLSVVVVTNAITLQSVNGTSATFINGSNAMRGIYLQSTSILAGFTITNGTAGNENNNGGGIHCQSSACLVTNCVIIGNLAHGNGGGVYQGTVVACMIFNNVSGEFGGGAANALIYQSLIIGNSGSSSLSLGGGVYDSTVLNSAIANNFLPPFDTGGSGGGAYGSALVNCTITGNSAIGSSGGGTASCNQTNCIIYYNSSPNYSNWNGGSLSFCCTTPNPGGLGDIISPPALASISHISLGSPCRGAGNASVTGGTDIDGNAWAIPPSMGCFEPYPGSVLGNPTVNISAPFTNQAPGYPINFQANISGPVYSNVWNLGDGTFITNQVYISHTWSTIGNYTVTLTAYNDSYPAGVTATLPITVAVPSVYYVNLNSGKIPYGPAPVPPYITWNTAAAHIQDAVNVAIPGTVVLVTNEPTIPTSPYNVTNSAAWYMSTGTVAPNSLLYTVVITNRLTVESVNGPAMTYIWGTPPSGSAAGCVYLTNGAALNGFTLTNATISTTAGVLCSSTNTLITNCIITHCSGGGVSLGTLYNCFITANTGGAGGSIMFNCVLSNNISTYGGGAVGGILNNCLIVTNSATYGGGVFGTLGYPAVLNNCILSNNYASQYGGGIYGLAFTNCVLNNCTLIHNFANSGGGAYNARLNNCQVITNLANFGGGIYGSVANNCIISSNSTSAGYAGGGAYNSTLNSCILINNSARTSDGGGADYCTMTNCLLAVNQALNGGGSCFSLLVNCTVVSNSASGGGGGTDADTNYNCIIYDNSVRTGVLTANYGGSFLAWCDTTPLPSGAGNITNDPAFVNLLGGNYHLQSTSPCINSGNNAYIRATTDLDGNPRIAGGTVDLGAYEYQTPTSVISYAYLQQYGLPTDGSVDFTNLDGSGFTVYQNWVAGLNPTNAASVLAMVTPAIATNNIAGITVTWQSVTNILYNLQRSTNLALPFTTIQGNISGHSGTTSYTDPTATSNVPYFYRVSVTAP